MDFPVPHSHLPSIAEVEQIATLRDPVLRNLQITQCYAELSAALAARTGLSANWCTFAAWASKQAGQSIRKEDLRRTLEHALRELGEPREVLEPGSERGLDEIWDAARQALHFQLTVDRVSQAVGRGNQKVFAEIGREFARFCAQFLDDSDPDETKLEVFCAELKPGDPPEGQRYLCQAFRRYYRAFFTQDPQTKAELLLCANLEIGLHEQTRLQSEIAEALDAGFVNTAEFLNRFKAGTLPVLGMAPQPALFRQQLASWLGSARLRMRHVLTALLMTIQLPPDLTLRLGDDLIAAYPERLIEVSDPELRQLLQQIEPASDGLSGSGARDWADLHDRLHFIAELFRCYAESTDLFGPPFTQQQVIDLKAGRKPAGRL